MTTGKNPVKGSSTSKRKEQQARRQKKQRQQRLTTIAVIAVAAVAVVALFAAPTVINAMRPVGEFVTITPEARENVDGRAIGDPNAPVYVEVFEDFQCPRCGDYSRDIEPQIIEKYAKDGSIYYIFRHYPFLDDTSGSQESDQSANASMCAMEQGKFWEYHDMLFANWNGENLGAFRDKRLVAFAEALGLDMDAFNACFKENKYASEIQEDIAKVKNYNITGTPTVIVNGVTVSPGFVPSVEHVSAAIESALAG